MYSIYHFFNNLVENKTHFSSVEKLEDFPFDNLILSCRNKGVFPDLAIRLNDNSAVFTGGELIELKDSKSYSVSSFNSTIPTRRKEISKIITSANSSIYRQMEDAGNNIASLPVREVFYLVRGKKKGNIKVCLVSGAFFETISSDRLIHDSFMQVLEDSSKANNMEVSSEVREMINELFSEQGNFSKVRNVDKASVKLRFRVMTEVKAEGNILNTNKYPEIKDNTLNLLLPYYSETEKESILEKFNIAFPNSSGNGFRIFPLKHHFNGYFLVFQINISH